ncbi:MAG: hypothetical protein JW818_23560 [Pirellulales bacterium]|nr:hypothetical protein [Pirellulales bacterium]
MAETDQPREGNVKQGNSNPSAHAPRTVQVPRRFPMGTMMLMVTLFAVLFAAMQSAGLPGVLIFLIAGLFLAVGMAQMWLFRGRRPKLASILAGALYVPTVAVVLGLIDAWSGLGHLTLRHWAVTVLSGYVVVPGGAGLGYIFGCLAASVFLVWRMEPDESQAEADEKSPNLTDDSPTRRRLPWDERLLALTIRTGRSVYRTRATVSPFRAWLNVTIFLLLFVGIPGILITIADEGPPGPLQWKPLLGLGLGGPPVLAALYVSLRLAGWKVGVTLPLLGGIGALPSGWVLIQIYSTVNGRIVPAVDLDCPLPWAGLAGAGLGAVLAGVIGWICHIRARRRGVDRVPPGRLAVVLATGVLVACLAIGFFFAQWYTHSPRQQALRMLSCLNTNIVYDQVSGSWAVTVDRSVCGKVDPAVLHGLGAIGHLHIEDVPNADDWLDAVRDQTQLLSLGLRNVQLGSKGLDFLARHPGLQNFIADNVNVTDADLQGLEETGWLRYLILRQVQITDAGLAHLADLQALDVLIIEGAAISDDGLKHLGKLPSLTTLHLKNTNITGNGLRHLGKLPALQDLSLANITVSQSLAKELNSLKMLTGLSIEDSELSPGCLEGLDSKLPLVHLSLAGTKFDNAELVHLKGLTCLESLDLSGTNIDDDAMVQVAAIRTLTTLTIDNTRVGNQGIRHLEGHPKLDMILLAKTQVDDAAVDSLLKIPNLRSVGPEWPMDSPFGSEATERLDAFLCRGGPFGIGGSGSRLVEDAPSEDASSDDLAPE